MPNPLDNLNDREIRKTMEDGDIQDVSLAWGSDKNAIKPKIFSDTATAVTTFGIASLSKPVFAYLVLKLTDSKGFALDMKLNDVLPFDEFCKNVNIPWENSPDNLRQVKLLTPSMVLSHQTGLPIGYKEGSGLMHFDFDPAKKQYGYSGIAIVYLQKCIEKHFKLSLETLAKEHVFGPAGMNNSSFYPHFNLAPISETTKPQPGNIHLAANQNGLHYEVIQKGKLETKIIPWDKLPTDFPRETAAILSKKDKLLSVILDQTSAANHTPPANAANSLKTTPSDYVRFCLDWLHNKDDKMQEAFKSKVSMNNDPWATDIKRANVSKNVLDHVDWGYGWGLIKDDNGKVTHAFHTGDMSEWRSGVMLDIENKTATVFFSKSKSENGHVLQEQIFGKNNYGLEYFFAKYLLARNLKELPPDWRVKPCYGEKQKTINNSTEIFSNLAAATHIPTKAHITSVKDNLSSTPSSTPKPEPQQQEKPIPPQSTNSTQQEEQKQLPRSTPK